VRRAAILGVVAACSVVAPAVASAHGGAQILHRTVDGYDVRVDALLIPVSPTHTFIDFTTYLRNRDGKRPVTGAEVRVTARTPDGRVGPLHVTEAGNTYAVLVSLRNARAWRHIRLTIAIRGPAGATHLDVVPPSLESQWHIEPVVVTTCLLALALFFQGFVRLRHRGRRDHASWDRAVLFVVAVALVFLALDSPLDTVADDYLLSAHMLEHVVIGDLAIALGLLALRGPLIFFFLPKPVLSRVARFHPLRVVLHSLTGPWVALALWAASTWAWHIPRIYDYAATHQVVHNLQHLSFVVTGVLIWNLLIDPARTGRLALPGRILFAAAVFLLGDPVMGALLDGGASYPHYARQPDRLLGLSPQADQHLAAIVMLAEQLLTLGTCGLILLSRYLKRLPAGSLDQPQAAGLRPR
jgi:cytochrome c oxidase assembly factor CtaG